MSWKVYIYSLQARESYKILTFVGKRNMLIKRVEWLYGGVLHVMQSYRRDEL